MNTLYKYIRDEYKLYVEGLREFGLDSFRVRITWQEWKQCFESLWDYHHKINTFRTNNKKTNYYRHNI